MLLLIVYKQELAANSCPPSKSLALYEELEELEELGVPPTNSSNP